MMVSIRSSKLGTHHSGTRFQWMLFLVLGGAFLAEFLEDLFLGLLLGFFGDGLLLFFGEHRFLLGRVEDQLDAVEDEQRDGRQNAEEEELGGMHAHPTDHVRMVFIPHDLLILGSGGVSGGQNQDSADQAKYDHGELHGPYRDQRDFLLLIHKPMFSSHATLNTYGMRGGVPYIRRYVTTSRGFLNNLPISFGNFSLDIAFSNPKNLGASEVRTCPFSFQTAPRAPALGAKPAGTLAGRTPMEEGEDARKGFLLHYEELQETNHTGP